MPEGPVRVSGARRRAQEEEIGAERAPWPELRWGPPDSTEHVFQKKKKITEAICKETLKATEFTLYLSCVFRYAVQQRKLVYLAKNRPIYNNAYVCLYVCMFVICKRLSDAGHVFTILSLSVRYQFDGKITVKQCKNKVSYRCRTL